MLSGERAFGEGMHGFEEVAGGLSPIGDGDVKLEVGLGAAQGHALHRQPGALGQRQQGVSAFECRGARVMHDQAAWGRGLARRPIGGNAWECVATRPAHGVESLDLERRGLAQHAADNKRVAAAADAAERPYPGHVARLQEDDQRHAGERSLGVADHHLDRTRAQPAHGGAPAEQRQATLHPAQKLASPTDIPDRAGGKPGDDRDRGNGDEFRHGGGDDSTPVARGWRQALREFIYGMTAYEFVQQALEMRASMQKLFLVGVFGDMLGVPVLPPYYGLRLLPWVVPEIEAWKREVLRERELGSSHEHHLHGL